MEHDVQQKKEFSMANISVKSFIGAFIILAVLMVFAYVLCFTLPAGEYVRESIGGQVRVVPDSYRAIQGGLPFWKWILSPILTLGGEGGMTMVAIIVFLFIIAGTFNALEQSGILEYMLHSLALRFYSRRKLLLYAVPLLFMSLGSFIGSFEECIPMTPIAISLALALGWDELTGLAMSLLAVGCGFAAGVLNPFTVGVAQSLANLPMFSGISFRLLTFVLIYALLMSLLHIHTRKIERNAPQSIQNAAAIGIIGYEADTRMDQALRLFIIILLSGIALILACSFIQGMSGLVLPVTALMFLVAGIVCVPASGATGKQYCAWFAKGVRALIPAVVLILMAGSIRYILTEGSVMDTILYSAIRFISGKPQAMAILLLYLLVLVFNAAIPSGSAKAFLLIPLIMPIMDAVGISRQLAVLAFIFGDGFSNVFYPTNPALLISLSIGGIGYGKWFRFTWKLQGAILLVTAVLLLIGLQAGY